MIPNVTSPRVDSKRPMVNAGDPWQTDRMLDWRAAAATTIVHVTLGMTATATLSWLEIVCRFPVPGNDMMIVQTPGLTAFSLWDRVDAPDAAIATDHATLSMPAPCATDRKVPMPELRVPPPPLSVTTAPARASVICLTVDDRGRVVAARLYRSSGDHVRDRRAIRSARQARFVVDRPGGVAITL